MDEAVARRPRLSSPPAPRGVPVAVLRCRCVWPLCALVFKADSRAEAPDFGSRGVQTSRRWGTGLGPHTSL